LAPTTPFPGRPEEENALSVASRGLLEVPQASSCSRAAQHQDQPEKFGASAIMWLIDVQ